MIRMTEAEVKTRFGDLMERAQIEPIRVTKSGRDTVVTLSVQEYDRLCGLDDRYWGERALEVIRTQQPLGAEATAQWLSDLLDCNLELQHVHLEASSASTDAEV
jgi:prevent-host-death family protein